VCLQVTEINMKHTPSACYTSTLEAKHSTNIAVLYQLIQEFSLHS